MIPQSLVGRVVSRKERRVERDSCGEERVGQADGATFPNGIAPFKYSKDAEGHTFVHGIICILVRMKSV